ncbi:MAG: beta-propeller domain-containing protein [Candidatus Moranbacteria bacterium]|nr:beta-propeller domain-containing protein [Candidatus Moranbacteria bacterium]
MEESKTKISENNFSAKPEDGGRRKKILVLVGVFAVAAILGGLIYFFAGNKDEEKEKEKEKNGGTSNISKNLQQKLADQSKLKKFEDYSQLKNFLESNIGSSGYNDMQFDAPLGMGSLEASREVADSGNLQTKQQEMNLPSEGGDDFSKTNVQVEGVDEADIVKTDGEYIYSVANQDLYISKAYPAQDAQVLSKIAFKSRPSNIYLEGDKMVVFGSESRAVIQEKSSYEFREGAAFFKVFDISDKKNPSQVRDLQFEGNYFDSRMIDDQVYFITRSSAYYKDTPVPRIMEDGKALYEAEDDKKCAGCPEVYYVDIPNYSYNYMNVASIDISSPNSQIQNEVYMLPRGQNMYVSQKNIYMTYTKHVSEYILMMEVMSELILPELDQDTRKKIEEIKSSPDYVLNSREKQQKISSYVERYMRNLSKDEREKMEEKTQEELKQKYHDISKELEKTVIQKISINKGELDYKSTGEVTGHVINQFSMSEKGGYFRIATTKSGERRFRPAIGGIENDFSENRESYSNAYVLDEDLQMVGSVEGLAEGERIYSARFMQDRLYMVTFKQVDPLFVIDLKNPKNPQVLGELKIPGYSNYLHPYDENTLIGLGKETKARETGGFDTKGLKISLFDVSDVSNPKEVDKYVFEDESTSSIAQHEHKAFLFSKEKNLLVVPVSTSGGMRPMRESAQSAPPPSDNLGEIMPYPPQDQFRGAAVFEVTKDNIELRDLIDHSGDNPSRETWCGSNCYDTTVKRSLYIEDTLYTMSSRYLVANQLSDLSEIKKLRFQKGEEDDFEVIN